MRREFAEQVLPDGGHFERSPMYHAAFVEDVLDIVGIMQTYDFTFDASWPDAIMRMMSWLEAMSHPDQSIAFFNDAAFGPTSLYRGNVDTEPFGLPPGPRR